jgi:hypothetical protein
VLNGPAVKGLEEATLEPVSAERAPE